MAMPTLETDHYFQRFGFCERRIASSPAPDLGLVVAVPCFNEPDLTGSMESLWRCQRPDCSVEVIVVVNSSAHCSQEIRLQNQATLKEAGEWVAQHRDAQFAFHTIHLSELPPKQAGVGLARKIGMDEALRRLDDVGRPHGLIVGYDADCRCEPNYLTAIEQYFRRNPQSPGCSIYFEHPLKGPLPRQVYEGIAAYELHLRYYVRALRYAGFPHAHHTLGSCMAVRAAAYCKQGGMNRRQAGEDFYFLHKIIPLGGFGDLTGTTVFPSPRSSDRVPFGTGKAVREFLEGQETKTYPLEAFLDLRQLFFCPPLMFRHGERFLDECAGQLPESVRGFLQRRGFAKVMKEIHGNTSTNAAFRKRFFRWFDAFLAMKFVHYARDQHYGDGNLREQAAQLLALVDCTGQVPGDFSGRELLKIYRTLDRAAKQEAE